MKSAIYCSIAILFMFFLIALPLATAQGGDQNDSEDEAGAEEGCIFGTFCLVMLFLAFLIYFSTRHKSEESRAQHGRDPFQTPPPRHGYRYPTTHRPYPPPPSRTYPQIPEPQIKDVKCDLCGSKNLRAFEEGYFRCNDCKHIFYIREVDRSRRR